MTAGGRVQARRSMSAFISCAATRRTSSRQRWLSQLFVKTSSMSRSPH